MFLVFAELFFCICFNGWDIPGELVKVELLRGHANGFKESIQKNCSSIPIRSHPTHCAPLELHAASLGNNFHTVTDNSFNKPLIMKSREESTA